MVACINQKLNSTKRLYQEALEGKPHPKRYSHHPKRKIQKTIQMAKNIVPEKGTIRRLRSTASIILVFNC